MLRVVSSILISLLTIGLSQAQDQNAKEIRQKIETYLNQRFLPKQTATAKTTELVKDLTAKGITAEQLEKYLRMPPVQFSKIPPQGKLLYVKNLNCDHVDYSTDYFLYIPKKYSHDNAMPLVLVGHGGNSSMSRDYARRATLAGIQYWLPEVEKQGLILAAPLSERGWGPIGNSILLTLISQLQRKLNIDPDRIYVTGHSMGGHLSWRSGISMPDRWGAIAPMSGGYDYVENKQVFNLSNVPGYATYGKREPYGINKFNNTIKNWMKEHRYDWVLMEKVGGHEIFRDEIPKVTQFFLDHPRNLYRPVVYARMAGNMRFEKTWEIPNWPKKHTWQEHRPIPHNMVHWLELIPLPEDTPKEQRVQTIQAKNLGDNSLEVVAENAKKIRLYFHPKMVDFARPIKVSINGKQILDKVIEPNLITMLDLVRRYDDRGRIFYASVELDVPGSQPVPEPFGSKKISDD